MAKNILLVRPRGSNSSWQQMATQPLGILYLTALLKRRGWSVAAVDGLIDNNWRLATLLSAQTQRPTVIGFSLLSIDLEETAKLVRALRQQGFRGAIIGGGSGISHADDRLLSQMDLDAVVKGEAEETLLEYVSAIENNTALDSIAGLIWRRNGDFHQTPERAPLADLDALPFPDQSVLPLARYFGRPSMDLMYRHPHWASIITSRSCPYSCAFCAHPMGNGFRPRSPENVLEEIDFLVHCQQVRELQIIDDIFNFDRERAVQITEMLIQRNYRLHLVFPNGLRLDRLDDELIEMLVRAGLDRLLAPIETASPRLQKEMGKNLDLDRVWHALQTLRRKQVFIRLSIMLGFPGETLPEMKQTLNFSLACGGHQIAFNRVIPLAGSRLERLIPSTGEFHWPDFNYVETPINLSQVKTETIYRLIRRTFLRTLTPRRMWTVWRLLPKTNLQFYPRILLAKLFIRKKKSTTLTAPA